MLNFYTYKSSSCCNMEWTDAVLFVEISSEIGKWKRKIDFKLVVTCHQQAKGYTVRDKSKPRKRSWEIFHICIWNEPICSIDDYQ
ncbi:hypothetical protein T08_9828 [Trichinella sp. T8]|nr:hypothetical protein T08_9828 [Trichinella sp. T8]